MNFKEYDIILEYNKDIDLNIAKNKPSFRNIKQLLDIKHIPGDPRDKNIMKLFFKNYKVNIEEQNSWYHDKINILKNDNYLLKDILKKYIVGSQNYIDILDVIDLHFLKLIKTNTIILIGSAHFENIYKFLKFYCKYIKRTNRNNTLNISLTI